MPACLIHSFIHSLIPPVPRCQAMVSSVSCRSVWDPSSPMVVLGAAQVSCLTSPSSCLLPLLGFLYSIHALLDWDKGTADCQANRGPEAVTAGGCVRPTHLPIPLQSSDFLTWCVSDLQIWELTHAPSHQVLLMVDFI